MDGCGCGATAGLAPCAMRSDRFEPEPTEWCGPSIKLPLLTDWLILACSNWSLSPYMIREQDLTLKHVFTLKQFMNLISHFLFVFFLYVFSPLPTDKFTFWPTMRQNNLVFIHNDLKPFRRQYLCFTRNRLREIWNHNTSCLHFLNITFRMLEFVYF